MLIRQTERVQQGKWKRQTVALATIQQIVGIKSTQPKMSGFCAFAEHVMGWVPLNPNSVEKVRALVSVYHLPELMGYPPAQITLQEPHPITQSYPSFESAYSDLLPSVNGFLSLYKAFTNTSSPLIYIGGKRGAGKTLALNFFLATAHRPLMQNGVLWFRTDIAKMWAYPEGFLSVAQYTILHSIYVALRYAGSDTSLAPIGSAGIGFQRHLDQLQVAGESVAEARTAWDLCLSAFSTATRRAKADATAKPVTDFLLQLQRDINRLGQSSFFDLYSEMISYLRDSASSRGVSLKVAIILDGVDNIRIDAHHDRYMRFLGEMIELFAGFPTRVGDKFVLVARPQTLTDVALLRTAMPNGHATPQEFTVISAYLTDIVTLKQSAVSNPVAYFHSMATAVIGRAVPSDEATKQFNESVDFLLNKLLAFSNQRTTQADDLTIDASAKPIDAVQAVFDGNLRSLLRNAIRAHSHRLSLSEVGMNRTLLEGSVLAACPAMPGNFDENVHGHWCPNLFENAAHLGGRWTGLSLVRLIQLLSACPDGVTKDSALGFLHRTFGYPLAQLSTSFQVASEFALLRSVGHELSGFDHEHVRPRQIQKFSTTEKGKYILDLVFKDYAVMYFMATGTPQYYERASKSLDHKYLIHSFREDRHFFRSAVISGTILWAHIFRADQQERSALRKTMQLGNISFSSSIFTISGILNWPDLAKGLAERLFRVDLDIVRAWLHSYFEDVPYQPSLDA